MSIGFDNTTPHSDGIDFGTALNNSSALDSDTLTVVFWFRPKGFGARILGNQDSGTFSFNSTVFSGTERVNLGRPRVTTQTLCFSNDDTIIVDEWNYIALVDHGDGNDSAVFIGNETTAVTDQTAASPNTADGAVTAAGTRDLTLANRDIGEAQGLQADYAFFAMWPTDLSIGLIEALRTNPHHWMGLAPAVLCLPGQHGPTNVYDFSGNGADGTANANTTVESDPIHVRGFPQIAPTGFLFPAAAGQTIAIGQALETDTAFGITHSKALVLGQALETDTAFAAIPDRAHAIGLASSVDTAFAMTHSKAVTLAQALETDTAFAATPDRAHAIGQALETDTAFAVAIGAGVAIGQALETDTAFAMTIDRAVSIGQALETDTAFAVAIGAGVAIGQALETDTAFVMTHSKALLLGQALETDTAFAVVAERLVALGLATETDTAFAMAHARAVILGQAIETDTAFAISHARALTLGLALEVDTAFPVTVAGLIVFVENIAKVWEARPRGRDWEARPRGRDWESRE